MSISFNTGATGHAETASSCNITIPAGVLVNDVMLLIVEVFCETGTTPTISFSGGGGTWTAVPMTSGANPEVATAGSSIWNYGYLYYRVATAGDPGATLTVSESGSAAGTTWFALALASYTGANTSSPADVAAGANAQGVATTTGPSANTGTANDWAVYLAAAGINGGSPTYSSGTSRESVVSTALVSAAIYDSNSTFTSGHAIGGGTWSQGGNASDWWSTFVVGLAPAPVASASAPSFPLTPPGRQSPMAYRYQAFPSAAPVLVPVSDSDSGSGADSASAVLGSPPPVQPLTPPGRQSPMAWQWHAGPTGAPVLVPVSDSDSGTGAESAYAGQPVQSQVLVPPGRISPAGWQWRALPSGAPLLVPVSDSDSGSGADSGSVVAQAGPPSYQLIPPGRSSPMALGWQRWPTAVAPASPLVMVSDSDSGAFDDEASFVPVIDPPPTGGWWQLHSIIEYARQEREFYATRPPMACPRCGEPMRPAPPSDSGSEVELYCLFDGFQYPRDWRPPFPV